MADSRGDMNASAVDREQHVFEAVPTSARAGRQFVTDTLREYGAPVKVISDYALAVSELVTNIIEHGDGSNLTIVIDVAHPDWWEVEVVGGSQRAPHHLLHPETWSVADADDASGRGLGIVRHLMDDIISDIAGGQVSIRCRHRRNPAS